MIGPCACTPRAAIRVAIVEINKQTELDSTRPRYPARGNWKRQPVFALIGSCTVMDVNDYCTALAELKGSTCFSLSVGARRPSSGEGAIR